MKKLTLEQALKTPNIAFIATPEQLEQINTEKMCINESIPNLVRFDSNCNLVGFSEYINDKTEDWYIKHYAPILIEIIEEKSAEFNSQQEVWQWLVEGNKCIWNGKPIQFIDGVLIREGRVWCTTGYNYTEFTKYKEPEYITVNGFQVPKPITSLEGLSVVYIPEISYEDFYDEISAYLECTKHYLKRNILHATKEAAITHAKAMLAYQE